MRTRWNVRDSDGTLILMRGRPDRGTALTRELAEAMHKPLLVVDLVRGDGAEVIREWIRRNGIAVLNVAGPRENSQPGIYAEARELLKQVFDV